MLPGKIYTQLGSDLSTLPTVPLPSQDKDLWCRYFSLLDQILLLWFSGVVNSCVQHSAIHLVPIIPNGNRHDAEHLRWVMDSVPSQDEKCLCSNYSSRIDHQDISRVCYHALYQGHFKRSLVRYLLEIDCYKINHHLNTDPNYIFVQTIFECFEKGALLITLEVDTHTSIGTEYNRSPLYSVPQIATAGIFKKKRWSDNMLFPTFQRWEYGRRRIKKNAQT